MCDIPFPETDHIISVISDSMKHYGWPVEFYGVSIRSCNGSIWGGKQALNDQTYYLLTVHTRVTKWTAPHRHLKFNIGYRIARNIVFQRKYAQ